MIMTEIKEMNMQKIRVMINGGVQSRRVCTSCIKAGKIVKA